MKRQIARRIAQSVAVFFFILIIADGASAQVMVSAKAGIISHIQGDAFLENSPLKISQEDYAQMENGQTLRTKQGHVELVLAPDVYLRLGSYASVRMEQNQVNDAQLALEQGSALIEVVEEIIGNRTRIRISKSVVEIRKAGLYRLQANPGELSVYGGEALVSTAERKAKIKRGRTARLAGSLASAKIDIIIAD